MAYLGILTLSWHMLFILFAWNVDMTPRDTGNILGDEKKSQVLKRVEQNGRRGLGLRCHHGACVPDLSCQPVYPFSPSEKNELLFG